MKDYFDHLFRYNDWANRLMMEAVAALEAPEEALYLFTHLILSQQRWLERVRGEDTRGRAWFGPAYDAPAALRHWEASLQDWLDHLGEIGDAGLARPVQYTSSEGPSYRSTVQEIVVQLNNHSVHHRAQMARMVRQQGHTPPGTDYIFFSRREA